MINIVLCGGSGTRLWPISRKSMPKQFCKLIDDISFFQSTLLRNAHKFKQQYIVTSEDSYFIALDQIESLSKLKKSYTMNPYFILEPVGRNTAPAIALACLHADEDEIMLVTPSDHLIRNNKKYNEAVDIAVAEAKNGYLVTFGIQPTYPETGYGYIEADQTLKNGKPTALPVISFHEKPALNTAKEFLARGNFYWNSGMFCFKAGTYLNELKVHAPEIYEKTKIAFDNLTKSDFSTHNITLDINDMLAIPDDSIDYAVMEKSSLVKVVSSDIGWNDIGSFDALSNEMPKDCTGNSVFIDETDEWHQKGQPPLFVNSFNNSVFAGDRKIVALDVDDLLIVDTHDSLLITRNGHSQKVKDVVQLMNKETIHRLTQEHRTLHRPWGSYTILDDALGFKIKRIVVKPGTRLSLQKHYHRSEHWVVVSGTATVTCGNDEKTVKPNESVYISMGTPHRLENKGKIPLIIVEVQVGEYLGEDDIVRLEDDYGRKK